MQAVTATMGLGDGGATLPLDSVFQRTDFDAALFADANAFERILAHELRHAGATSPLALSVADLTGPAERSDPSPILATPPWEPAQTGAAGVLDGGLSLQNGAVFTKAGEGYIAPNQLDALASAGRSGDIAPTDSWRIDFDAGGVDLLKATIYDRQDHLVNIADAAPPSWLNDVGFSPTDADNVPSFADRPSPDNIWMDRVFFNGDGRPILPPRSDERHDIFADGDVMILPDGAVVAFDPWTAAVDMPVMFDGPVMGSSLQGLGGTVIIDGELL